MSQPMPPGSLPSTPRSGSRSDHALPGLGWIAVLVVLVAAALLFVGYRVFEIESQRRAINEGIRLLQGKDQILAEASKAELKLFSLRREVAGAEEALERLRTQSSDTARELEKQRGQLQASHERLEATQGEIQAERSRRQALADEARALQSRIDQLQQSAEQARLAADTASRTADGLRADVGDLESKRESLRKDVNEMQAQLQIRDDFNDVFDVLTTGSEQLATSAQELEKAVRAVASETQRELAGVSRSLADSTERLRQSSTDLTNVANALRDAERPMNQSQARFDQAVGALEDAVTSASTDLGRLQKQLAEATGTVTEVADRLPSADTRLASELSRLLERFETFKTEADRTLATMQATSLKIDKAADEYVAGVAGAEERLRSSTQRLESSVSDLERARPAVSDPGAPSEPRESSGEIGP